MNEWFDFIIILIDLSARASGRVGKEDTCDHDGAEDAAAKEESCKRKCQENPVERE